MITLGRAFKHNSWIGGETVVVERAEELTTRIRAHVKAEALVVF